GERRTARRAWARASVSSDRRAHGGNGSPRSLLPDVWIAAHPEHFLRYCRDEAEAAAIARRRRRERRRAKAPERGSQSRYGISAPRGAVVIRSRPGSRAARKTESAAFESAPPQEKISRAIYRCSG